jgi:hypothetical protein
VDLLRLVYRTLVVSLSCLHLPARMIRERSGGSGREGRL